ncbi:DUF4286 family protein [Desertivirga brevis]|uniref:DUF4286 family protein n=1 Tax=Desertivirga brevis TaxID=2810310 RepID=UPI001A9736B0|nr:DUF4286 family protein [Pedobacter sp. SYSU D00873]
MVLFNITIIIDDSINDEWLRWINEEFIPEAMSSNLIASKRLLKVLDSPNEGITYCLQFVLDTIASYQSFQQNQFASLMNKHSINFNNKFVSFNTLMEFID